MPLEEIKKLPIVHEQRGKDCVLFLWATVPLLPQALEVMSAWGFTYKTKITWRKVFCLGMGWWFRGQVEDCLVGIRGNIKAFHCQHPNFIQARVLGLAHSEKPEEFWQLIEPIVEEHDLNPKIELFSRKQRPGWDVFGNQVEKLIVHDFW
jgi:N6-adenosine-specific RNA methylase IME4